MTCVTFPNGPILLVELVILRPSDWAHIPMLGQPILKYKMPIIIALWKPVLGGKRVWN